jgi:rhamnogalacturonan endolyase
MRKLAAAMLALVPLFYGSVRGATGETNQPVVIRQSPDNYVLDNGLIAATISRSTGDLLSLRSDGREMLAQPGRIEPGTWSTALAGRVLDRILVNPKDNQGNSAEISIRMATPMIVDMRYALARGDHALFVYQLLDHPANLYAARVSSGGFSLRLSPDLFDKITTGKSNSHWIPSAQDWMNGLPVVSTEARKIANGKFAGKLVCDWDDSARQMDTPVFGYSSSGAPAGIWLINPSAEYLSRGGNLDAPTGWQDPVDGAPVLMNRWGGEPGPQIGLTLSHGDAFSHVIGPFLIYCNNGSFADAQARAQFEQSQWPYKWTFSDESVPRDQRSFVVGQIAIQESPLVSQAYPANPPLQAFNAQTGLQNGVTVQSQKGLQNGVTVQPHVVPTLQAAPNGPRKMMVGLTSDDDWQTNYFDHQIWVLADKDGHFAFTNILPGTYVLHVYCDGQFGEAISNGVQVSPGQTLDLGKIIWRPRHYGWVAWQLATPDHSAGKFAHGADLSRWGLWTLNPREFPNGVNFIIGKSDPAKDWNFAQSAGSTWTVHFNLGWTPLAGEGFIDIALAGGSAKARLSVSLNGKALGGRVQNPPAARGAGLALADDIVHDQVRGMYREDLFGVPRTSLRAGDNILRLRVDGEKPTDGLMYDSLRMEIRVDSYSPTPPGAPITGAGFMPTSVARSILGVSYQGDQSGNYTSLEVPHMR